MSSSAAVPQSAPTDGGTIVLAAAEQCIEEMYGCSILNPAELTLLREDLLERAEFGKRKYGTYLRINNGRSAAIDAYQEICDFIMYVTQARMEGNKAVGKFLELAINIGSQLAGVIPREELNAEGHTFFNIRIESRQ